LFTSQRQNKVASSSIFTFDDNNFGDSGYEVMTRHEDHAKAKNRTKKELHVLKQQLKEEHELHR